MSVAIVKRERRTRQFEHYFDLMEHRTLRLARAPCYLVFTTPMPHALRARLGNNERFAQFAFWEGGFYLDMPDSTLTPQEARIVMRRPGFEFALDKPHKTDAARLFDPVQRCYRYEERLVAAEDTAYVFFDLWRNPLDGWIRVDAWASARARTWENCFLMG